MDCVICRLSRSSLLLLYVRQTIYRINHLFQNGRALLKCRSFILLQLVIPTLKSHAATRHVTTRTCHCEQTFQDGPHIFHPCCWLRSGFRACCVVVVVPLQPQFRHFAAKWSSFSYVYCENSTGFDVFNIAVRFVSCLLCCCWVSLQPQFRQFFSDFFLIFVVIRENSTGFESKHHRLLCVVNAVLLLSSLQPQLSPASVEKKNLRSLRRSRCVVVESHSSHSAAISPTG